MRVLDPQLTEFTRVLRGKDRPSWVVVNGTSLATWGVDSSQADALLAHEYRLVDVEGDYHVYRVRTRT